LCWGDGGTVGDTDGVDGGSDGLVSLQQHAAGGAQEGGVGEGQQAPVGGAIQHGNLVGVGGVGGFVGGGVCRQDREVRHQCEARMHI